MKSLLLFALSTCLFFETLAAQDGVALHTASPSSVEASSRPLPVRPTAMPFPATYQRLPEFPGGFDDMVVFLQREVKYPAAAVEASVEGIVELRLTIDAYGIIRAAEVVKPLGFGCEEEALRVALAMPRWEPAQQGNYYIPSKITIPIQFKLQ